MTISTAISALRSALDAAYGSRDALQLKVDEGDATHAVAVADALAAGQTPPRRPQTLAGLHASLEDCEAGIAALERRLADLERQEYADRQTALAVEIPTIAASCVDRASLGLALVRLGAMMTHHGCDGVGLKEAIARAADVDHHAVDALLGGDHRRRIVAATGEARALQRDISPRDLVPHASAALADVDALLPAVLAALGPIMAEHGMVAQQAVQMAQEAA